MKESSYIPSNNFEVSVFITMTEFSHKKAKKSGFRNMNEWCLYYRKKMIGEGNVGDLTRDLIELYSILDRMHALTISEITTYAITYFKYYVWRDYEALLNARKAYTGKFY